tara:strand:- start:23 stop:277 length:255 start_codon:yes stop_codon:yes gene_type:complete
MGNILFFGRNENVKLQEKNEQMRIKILNLKRLINDKNNELYRVKMNYNLLQFGFIEVIKDNNRKFNAINNDMNKLKKILKVKTC